MYVTTGQTRTMILRIFLCTLGWSIKLVKNWDTEKLKLSEKFKRDTRLARLTSFNAPGQRFTVQLLVHFSKMVTNKSNYNAVNSF